jgi:CHAT domain-containing protein
VEPFLEGKTVVGIVPFQILHFLPFSALLTAPFSPTDLPQDSLPQYFIDQYAVFSLPSLSVLPFVRSRTRQNVRLSQTSSQQDFLGIGNATDNLPGAEEEINTIRAYFPEATTYTGDQATKQRLFDEARQYTIVHLATHGVFDKQHPLFSYLELSSDTHLYAREIFGLPLRSTLVTLSGCETLLPQHIDVDDIDTLVSGDELVGFVRAFMYAGTPSILSSLWKIGDQPTQLLMRAFYQQVMTRGKAKALQHASRQMMQRTLQIGRRKTRELWLGHPVFWASFVLIGDWK